MSTLDEVNEISFQAKKVWFLDGCLHVLLDDNRIISNPLSLYPFLEMATEEERNNNEIFGEGTVIYFSDIDEYISVADIVLGVPYFLSNLLEKETA